MNRIDLNLLAPSIILITISLLLLFFLDNVFFRQQFIFLIISLFIFILFLNLNLSFFRSYSYVFYLLMLLVLFLSFFIGIEARGAVRWIELFGIRIQFSEIFKPLFILFFASYLAKDDSKSFKKFLVGIALFIPLFLLVLRQPDLGNAIIYFLTVLFMFLVYGFKFRFFIFLGICGLVLFPIFLLNLRSYQQQRIISFLNPSSDQLGTSYNAIQSIISVGSGGFFGRGVGSATQSLLKFLPERHTDFIFATFAEAFGFIGVVFILSLFFLLIKRIYVISQSIKDPFSYLIVMGVYVNMLMHIFVNIGMNIGILPVVGITLPFLSYGGSSLLTNFIFLGIVSAISSNIRRNEVVEIL